MTFAPKMRSSIMVTLSFLVLCCLVCTVLVAHKFWTHEKAREVPRVAYPEPLVFTYEKGDVIGTFAVKIAEALTSQGILTVALGNVHRPDYFWHSAYRPNQWRPVIQPNQSVFYNLENVRIDPKHGETVLQTRYAESDQVDNHHIVYVPWAWVAFEERYLIPDPRSLLQVRTKRSARSALMSKSRFCSFMASYCNYEGSYLQIYGPFMMGIKQVRLREDCVHRVTFSHESVPLPLRNAPSSTRNSMPHTNPWTPWDDAIITRNSHRRLQWYQANDGLCMTNPFG